MIDRGHPTSIGATRRLRVAVRRVWRAPVTHFLAIGGLIFAIANQHGAVSPRFGNDPIAFTPADIAELRRAWVAQSGAAPGASTDAQLIDAAIDDEVLYREALALGLDQREPVVRERLARLARFVDDRLPEDPGVSEAAARRLGLDRHDLVIRRYLVNSMRTALTTLAPSDQPTAQEIAAYYNDHPAEFRRPSRVRLVHVYFSRDRRGPALEADAERLLDEFRRRNAGAEAADGQGDPFIRGTNFGPATAEEIERVFGAAFASAVKPAEPRKWIGPIASSYGMHLVWVRERLDGGRPPLASVKGQVLHQLVHSRQLQRQRQRLDELRTRYGVAAAQARFAQNPDHGNP
ncbi:MAG TPA: peptidyl-prolyl cis-trans isomerase [Candidatus Kryptonia bacterium]|nr:peptidyl-prolyl cis-trans isomerase [Candidatus Kryptonia bacterium]